MGSAPASLADNPFLITLLLEMQTTIFLRTEMSRKTEYVHNPCFLSANILKILGVFAENQLGFFEKRHSIFNSRKMKRTIHSFHSQISQKETAITNKANKILQKTADRSESLPRVKSSD